MKNLSLPQLLNFLTVVFLTFAVTPASSQINNIGQDTLPQMICGDLHEYIAKNQAEYAKFLNNEISNYTPQEDWNPEGVFQCGSFTVYYEDFDATYQAGFADPVLGEARRNTLCEVLSYVESVLDFHPNANPILVVHYSLVPNDNPAPLTTAFLATSVPEFPLFENSEIYDGFLSQYIISGLDPDSQTDVDAHLTVNFDRTFSSEGTPFPPINYFNSTDDLSDPFNNVMKYDLYSVLLHEITHALGFLSLLHENEIGELECVFNTNIFSRFDWKFGYYGDILNPT